MDGSALPRRARSARWRRAGALALAAALGAGAALLAVRGSDADGASLVALGAYPQDVGGLWGRGEELSLTVVVGNTGADDLVVLGGGTRTGAGDPVGELGPTGFAPVDDRPADAVAALPAGATAVLEMTVAGSCEDPPRWEPWMRVRTPTGDTADVPLAVLRDPTGAGTTGFEDACASVGGDTAFTPFVVGQSSTDDGLVLQVRNDAEAPYVLEVLAGGVAGLELVDPDAVVAPGGTTEVALRVAPRRCGAALGASDLVSDVALQATRSGEAGGARSVRLDLDLFSAGTVVGLAVGRACAAGA